MSIPDSPVKSASDGRFTKYGIALFFILDVHLQVGVQSEILYDLAISIYKSALQTSIISYPGLFQCHTKIVLVCFTSLATLSKLKPSFNVIGTVHFKEYVPQCQCLNISLYQSLNRPLYSQTPKCGNGPQTTSLPTLFVPRPKCVSSFFMIPKSGIANIVPYRSFCIRFPTIRPNLVASPNVF